MRKVLCMLTVLVLCVSMVLPVFAAEDGFVPSITYKPNPELVPTIGEDGKEYYEKDGICLIVENGKCVGYYRPHGTDVWEREVKNDEEASYVAPSAEVVDVGRIIEVSF